MKKKVTHAGLVAVSLALGLSATTLVQAQVQDGASSTGELQTSVEGAVGQMPSSGNYRFLRGEYVKIKDTTRYECVPEEGHGYVGYSPTEGFALRVCHEGSWVPLTMDLDNLQCSGDLTPPPGGNDDGGDTGTGESFTFTYDYKTTVPGTSVAHGMDVGDAEAFCAGTPPVSLVQLYAEIVHPGRELISVTPGGGGEWMTPDIRNANAGNRGGGVCSHNNNTCGCTWTVDAVWR